MAKHLTKARVILLIAWIVLTAQAAWPLCQGLRMLQTAGRGERRPLPRMASAFPHGFDVEGRGGFPAATQPAATADELRQTMEMAALVQMKLQELEQRQRELDAQVLQRQRITGAFLVALGGGLMLAWAALGAKLWQSRRFGQRG